MSSTKEIANPGPLPISLGGVRVRFDPTIGFQTNPVLQAPLFLASSEQIGFQIPWELQGQFIANFTVTNDALSVSAAASAALRPFAPALFPMGREPQAAAIIAATGELAAAKRVRGMASRPVHRGESVSLYGTGFGPVSNQPNTGAVALSDPQSLTLTVPIVTVGGVPARVTFSGLAPGTVGVYRVDFDVPNAGAGDAVPVVLRIGDGTSNTVTIAVE